MRSYELAVVLKASLSETQRKKVLDTIKGWMKNVKITKEDELGLKLFHYQIKKEKSGYFMIYSFESESGISPDLEKKILGSDTIIRHLLVRKK